MATKDEDKKRHRGREAASSYHLSHLGGRHHPSQRVGSGSKYDYSASAPLWAGLGSLQSSLGFGYGATGASPYTVTDFTMLVEDADQPVHDFTSLSRDGRQPDLSVTDTALWHRQYPEFTFLQKQTDDWAKKHQKVLICDASIKVMTETRPKAHLSIAFDLHSHRDLRPFDSLVCTTRFYDDGKMDADQQFDGPHHHDLKEHRTSCEYTPDPHGCSGRLRLAFGSRFWVNRMSKYQTLRHKDDNLVGRSLMKLTATQDVYGISPSGGAECILTILWRFRQTRDSVEVGQMKWRAVSFGALQTGLKQEWTKQESLDDMDSDLLDMATAQSQPAHQSLYDPQTALGQLAHQAYAVQPYHTQPQPPQLHIDTLTSWPCTAPDLSTPSASAAPSTATDHSFASLPHMSHSQDTAPGFDANDFDFTGGRIDISGAFSPAIMASYDAFSASQGDALGNPNAFRGMDQQSLLDMGLSMADIAAFGVSSSQHLSVSDPSLSQLGTAQAVQGCYSTKPVPSWAHSGSLISALESQAEGYVTPWPTRGAHAAPHEQANHGPQHHGVHAQHTSSLPIGTYASNELVGHGELHSSAANLNPTLWNLASPFHEDTSSGALSAGLLGNMGVPHSVMERKDSMQQNGLGLGVLDLIERDQRARGY
jgi:transcriptional enhancer factor